MVLSVVSTGIAREILERCRGRAIVAKPVQFVENMINFTRTYGFDGFQIDEELKGLSWDEQANTHAHSARAQTTSTPPPQVSIMRVFDKWAEALHGINASLTIYKGCVRNHLPTYLCVHSCISIGLIFAVSRCIGAPSGCLQT